MKEPASHTQLIVYTIGHSTRSLNELVELLRSFGIERLVDVRTIPRSRHNPQFNYDNLSRFLRNRHFSYRHMKDLGGLRHPRSDSPNLGWHNTSFRGFADYMQTPEFSAALEKFKKLAQEKLTVIMCAEAVPWRCHRSLIGDALIVIGAEVRDIYSMKSVKNHTLTAMARVQGTQVTYPPQDNANGKSTQSSISPSLPA